MLNVFLIVQPTINCDGGEVLFNSIGSEPLKEAT